MIRTHKVNQVLTEELDGRRLRSVRCRESIIGAVLALQDEGILVPTAQQISDRAGVGIRTFFRHFEDMEGLFDAVDSQIRSTYESMFMRFDEDGPLELRIINAVQCYADAFEQLNSVNLSAAAQRWQSKVLQRNLARGYENLHRNLEHRLPELKILPESVREAVFAVMSFEMWHRLREHQNLGQQASIRVMQDTVLCLVIARRSIE